MDSTVHERRRRLLRITFVFVMCFAAGLIAAGAVAGASPLAALSALSSAADDSGSTTDTTATDTTGTDPTATDTTGTEPTDTTPTDTTPSDTAPTETDPVAPTGAASPSAPPTLVSDKPDYMPGETVTLTGANWMPGEVVRISVNDDKGQTWVRTADVTAALDGSIRDQFQLPTTFVATYTATATGPVSGTATTTFTDGNVKWDTNTPADVTETVYTAASNCTGAVKNGYPKTFKSSDTVGVGNNESVRLDAEAVADNGSVFQAWSSPDTPTPSPFTVISGTGGRSICVAGFQSGSRNYLATYASNTAPTASAVTTSTSEDTPKAITLSGSDAQQCELTFSIVSGPANGSLGSISNNSCTSGTPNTDTASVTYTPNLNFNGSDSFAYKVNDGTLDSNTATVSITVTAVDDPPVAVNDSATVNEDSGASAIDVLANDTDVDGGPKSVQAVTQPANGSVAITGGGTGVSYTPNANYCNGGSPTDNFIYTLNGGSTASVAVTVTCVDDPPVAVNDSATVNEDSGATAINVLANDTDGDGGPKSVQAVTQPANGSVAITGGGTGVSYTPNANYCNGGSPTDNFTYTLNGGSTATVAVRVTCIDDPPAIAFTSGDTSADEGDTKTYAFSIIDPDSTSFTYESGYPKCGTGGALVGTPSIGASSGSFQCTFSDGPASPIVAAKIRDASAASNEITRGVSVANVPPKVTLTGPATADEGESVSYGYTFTDPGADSWTHQTSCGANGLKSDDSFSAASKSGSFTCTWADNYASQSVSATVTDDDAGSDADSKSVVVANVPPKVTLTGPATADEGETKSYSFTFTDPGEDGWTRVVSCGLKGTVSNSTFTPATKSGGFDCTFTDGPSSTVLVTVTDDDGGSGSDSKNVSVANLPPNLTITDPAYGQIYPVSGANVTFKGSFTDPGTGDTHTCSATWDDGSSSAGVVVESNGSGTCTATQTYTAAGVYTISMTVTDDEGAADTERWLVVVYDPNGGFVTGGGWINSPAGAYRADPSLTGRANFGFVSKYKKGATVPEGQTEFQFQTGNLNFHSETYQWLVVSGNKAQYKGTGTINGSGSYGFLLTAYDGSPDRFRIKITGSGGVVYDNKYGSSEDIDGADPQAISGGSIVVHKG